FNVAFGMNRRGVVAAWAAGVNPQTLVFTSTGYTVDLRSGRSTTFAPLPGDDSTLLSAVTDGGQVYGFSYNDQIQRVVAFDPAGDGTGRAPRSEPFGFGTVVANDRFVVETYSGTADPVILIDGRWVSLPSLVPNLGTFVLGDASMMSPRGDLVGSGFL